MSGGIRPPAPKNYLLPTHFPSLSRAKRIGLDLESHDPSLAAGKGPGWRREAYIIGFALSIGDDKGNIEFSEYYPCRHQDGPNLNPGPLMDWLGTELAFYQGEITGANLLYDADGYSYEGIMAPMAKWRDVQWAEALIDENAFNYKLDRLATKYCGHGKVKGELEALYGPGYKERMREIHPGHMRAYGRGDVDLPMQILQMQMKELRHQKLEEVFDLECRLLPILLYMRRKGQPVNNKHADNLGEIFMQKRAEALREATKAVGKRGLELTVENFGRPKLIGEALDYIGLPYPKTEKKGQASVRDEWLAAHAEEYPFCGWLAKANKYDKALETFVTGYVSDYAINGRVHCEFHPLRSVNGKGKSNGTVVGRFSAVHPNLQNIPVRDEEIGPLCRAMFVPEEGYNYFSGDYCIRPKALVLTSELLWKPAKDLRIGEKLIGCDEQARTRIKGVGKMRQHYLRPTFVEAIKHLRQPCLRIITDKGTVECSNKHRWLSRPAMQGSKHNSWVHSESLKVGDLISFIAKPWETDESTGGGYLAGLFDGEGSLDRFHGAGRPSFAQKNAGDNKLVLKKGIKLLKERGFALTIDKRAPVSVGVNGGREAALRFLGSIRPVRLLAKSNYVWNGHAVRSRATKPAKVLAIENIGEKEVIAVQTTTKTLIVEGFVSHNSQIEYREIVHAAVLHAQMPREKATKMWGKNGIEIWEKLQTAFITRDKYINDPTTDFHTFMATLTGLTRKYAKCLDGDTLISTMRGLQPIKTLIAGDADEKFHHIPPETLADGYGKWVTTNQGIVRKEVPCVFVITRQAIVCCSAEHRWLTSNGSLIAAKDLLPETQLPLAHIPELRGRPQTVSVNLFDQTVGGGAATMLLDEKWAYLAGVFHGDGTSNDSSISITHGAGNDYKPWRESIRNAARAVGIEPKTSKYKTATSLGSRVANRIFAQLGLIHDYTKCARKNLRIPWWVLAGGRKIALAYLAGLVDTDGTIGVTTNLSITTHSPEYCGQLLVLIRALGYQAFAGRSWNKDYKRFYYRAHIAAADLKRLADELPLKTEKGNILRQRAGSIKQGRQIISDSVQAIVNAGLRTVYDFEVNSTNHLYLQGGLIGHNSVNFAVAFVMGLQSFAEGLGWVDEHNKPTQKAIDTLATYHTAVPFVKAVGTAMTHEAEVLGYTASLLDRRAHYDRWEPKFYEEGKGRAKALPLDEAKAAYGEKLKRSMTHAALNRYTQMGGADMMKTTLVQAWESGILEGDDLIISLTVHDELDGSVARTARGKECLTELQHIMENAIKLTVPTTTEFKLGPNWSETH